jgi:C-terminal processing protease CtpA/Prc
MRTRECVAAPAAGTQKPQATSAGVRVYEVEGTPMVFSVTPDSEAARAGVTVGMVVQTINGQPIAEAITQARREVGASSSERATRLLSYSRLLAGEPGSTLKLGLARADGTPFEVTLTRRTVSAAPQFARVCFRPGMLISNSTASSRRSINRLKRH